MLQIPSFVWATKTLDPDGILENEIDIQIRYGRITILEFFWVTHLLTLPFYLMDNRENSIIFLNFGKNILYLLFLEKECPVFFIFLNGNVQYFSIRNEVEVTLGAYR